MKASDLAKGLLKKTEKEVPVPGEETAKEGNPSAAVEPEATPVKTKRRMPSFRLSELEILGLPLGEGELTKEEGVSESTFRPLFPESKARDEVPGPKEDMPDLPTAPEELKSVPAFRLSDMAATVPKPASLEQGEQEESAASLAKEEKPTSPVAKEDQESLTGTDAVGLYRIAKTYLSDLRERIRRGMTIDIRPVAEVMGRLIKENLVTDEITQGITLMSGAEEYYVSHAVNTAAYAVRVGRGLGYDFESLKELAMAGFLCDIGLFMIPEEIINKQGKLSPEEVELIKSHTEIAQELLAPVASQYPAMLRAIGEHHERENGQGYPRGLKGEEISEFAKIIGICDSYVAMTHNRPHKKALIQTETIRELVSMKGNFFSARIIKAFLDEISIFPIGSYVVLNNKMIGMVVATNRYSPFKPAVKILYDEHGRKFENPRVVDLMTNPVLNIESNISVDDLPRGN
ncbi:MAG TPA: HD-GYP domain-containing protein [Syntrophales bacterium]|nr:HD-GYP domain-containing protein [Syntrophales bacterium]HOL59796.1 HD-GYP domain-containing protein [Syntrophales bacterium]HPO35986.1 HD-GYP domain-containing protein [Syntrophales bacterium]